MGNSHHLESRQEGYTMMLGIMDKVLCKWYTPLMILICAAFLCGHVIPITSSVNVFYLFLLVALAFAAFCKKPMPGIFFWVVGYFLVYIVWTLTMTLLWQPEINTKETAKFFLIPILVISLSRLMLVSPRKMLHLFFYISMAYLIAMIAMGAVEYFTGWHLSTSLSFQNGKIPTGLSYNQNDYSALLTMAALYVFAYCVHFLPKKWLILAFAAMTACFIILKWTACNTGIVVLVIAVAIFLLAKIKKRKTRLIILASVLVASSVFIICKWDSVLSFYYDAYVYLRTDLYGKVLVSLYDSYGLGFGIDGDKYYFTKQYNYYINPHSHILQILLTSGLPTLLLFCMMIAHLIKESTSLNHYMFWIMPLLYILLLFTPSSSLYLWGHYVFFCIYVCYAGYIEEEKQDKPTENLTIA